MTEIVCSRVVGPSKIKHSTAENFLFLESSLKKVMLSQIFMRLKFTGMSSLALGRERLHSWSVWKKLKEPSIGEK